MYVLKYPWCWQRRDLCRKWVHLYEKYAACHFIEERHHPRSGGSWKPKLWGGVSQKLGGVWPWICLHRRTYKVTNVCIYKKLPPTKFYLLVIGEWQRAWAEIDTFSCHIESGLKKTNNCQGTRVFPIILYMSVENTIPWENSDSHLMKSKGTWGGCIIVTHKDLEELWRLRLLPTPAWAEWCLVFRLSSCTMLGNVVWPYILKTTLCMVLGLGPCLFPFALTSGGPSCAKSCLMKNLGSCSLKVLLADPL